MSNICSGQQQWANRINTDSRRIVSLTTPLVGGNKMISLIVLLFAVSTLLDSSAPIETTSSTTDSQAHQSRHSKQTNRLTREDSQQQVRAAGQPDRNHHRRATRSPARNTTATKPFKMQHFGPRKRTSQVARSLNHTMEINHSKRLRSSHQEETFSSRDSTISLNNSTTLDRHQADNDINNNNQIIASININNNNSNSQDNSTVYTVERTRQVSSLNGTIDLSRYEQDDVDRLYSDALLVYVKNFNE